MSRTEPKLETKKAQEYLDAYNRARGSRYRIGEYCGGGALGAVFRIPDTHPAMVVKISESVQVKTDGRRVDYRRLCRNEIQVMEHLGQHPNIMPLLDSMVLPAGEGEAWLLFMPEYTPLEDWSKQRGGLTERELCRIGMDLCQALTHCQRRQILHRDLKPGNIFVATDGAEPRFVLGDYNIARLFTKEDTAPLTNLGTDGFASPEIRLSPADRQQFSDRPDAYREARLERGCYNSDVYGLGVSLYYLLMQGQFPTLRYRTGAFVRTLDKISEDFERVIWKAVRFQPKERYATAADMGSQLRQLRPGAQMVCEDNCFIWAKEALLGRKWTDALELASMGISLGDGRCRRLRAYCQYRDLLRAGKSADEPMPQEQLRSVSEYIQEELYEMYRQQQDPAALFLSALIRRHGGDSGAYTDIRTAAELGYAPAQFFWGQRLSGQLGSREGYPFLIESAQAGFPAAMRYVKRYRDQGYLPEIDALITTGLRTGLEMIPADSKADYFRDVIRYL